MARKEIVWNYWDAKYELDPEGPTGLKWREVLDSQTKQYGHVAGDPAGKLTVRGYYRVRSSHYGDALVHRVVWALHYKENPPEIIDHIDGDKTNNRIENLRGCTNQENTQNWSGKGYWLDKKTGRYQACISVDGKHRYLGAYVTTEEASAAYLKAKLEYHPAYTPR